LEACCVELEEEEIVVVDSLGGKVGIDEPAPSGFASLFDRRFEMKCE
jgi:hypothetical protein